MIRYSSGSVAADRKAGQFRLLLRAAAYWLLDTLRRWLLQAGYPRLQLGTLRVRLIKIGGWVRERVRGVAIHLARSHPGEPLLAPPRRLLPSPMNNPS